MSVLADHEIVERCKQGMITPFVDHAVREENGNKIISYGASAYGYDIRITDEFQIQDLSCMINKVRDPKNVDKSTSATFKRDIFIMQPNTTVLCRSLEHFKIPKDIMCTATGKSTYARCGIIANITPLEAGWEGYLTISLSNTSSFPVVIYANEGIAQLIFHKVSSMCTTSYAEKGGKYMNQKNITESKV